MMVVMIDVLVYIQSGSHTKGNFQRIGSEFVTNIDGAVYRSNRFVKAMFLRRAEKVAIKEAVYKWSTEDMCPSPHNLIILVLCL